MLQNGEVEQIILQLSSGSAYIAIEQFPFINIFFKNI